MSTQTETRKQADVVVVGSGPGGATIARELARAGRRVVLLERGRDHRRAAYYGTYLGALLYADRCALFFSREGLQIVRPLMLGGATSMYCGSGALPPAWLKARHGVDVEPQARQAAAELAMAPLPPELRGAASTRIAEAASSLGMDWQPQPKLMRPARARRFACGAHCMLGCRCQAKWSAAEWVDDAIGAGASLLTEARVTEVLRADGRAAGVRAELRGRGLVEPVEIEAPTVVLAAGGLGSPEILRRSGFSDAGRGLAMDTTVIVYGRLRSTGRGQSRRPDVGGDAAAAAANASGGEPSGGPGLRAGNGNEPPMTWSYADLERGFMLSTLIDPWLMYPIITALGHIPHAFTWPAWGSSLGVMIKLKDDLGGELLPDGGVTKPLSPNDRLRLSHAVGVARRILERAGAEPRSVFVSPPRGTHPSATVRIGEALDRDLQTALPGLYVCDASVFPEALGQPTVVTIIALAKRLAEQLARRSSSA